MKVIVCFLGSVDSGSIAELVRLVSGVKPAQPRPPRPSPADSIGASVPTVKHLLFEERKLITESGARSLLSEAPGERNEQLCARQCAPKAAKTHTLG